MIEGIIFDVDGVLLDSMKIWDQAGDRYLESLGKEPEIDLNKILFPLSMDEGAEYLKKRYGLSQSCGEIAEGILATVADFYADEVQLKEGALMALDAFKEKGMKMTVATSSNRAHIESAFKRLGIDDYFLHIFTCSEIGASKRNPLIFFEAAARMATVPEQTVVVEDGLYSVITAKAAGFKTVGIYDESSSDDWEELRSEADVSLGSLAKYEKLFETL